MQDYREIRQQCIDASLYVQRKGLINGTSGNISVRSADGKCVAITPSGIEYASLEWDMIPLVDLDAKVLDIEANARVIKEGLKPSSEVPMHTAVMRARPDVNVVIHTHCMYCTILSYLGQELPIMTIPMIGYFPTPAPIMPFEFPGSTALAESAVKGLGEKGSAVILEKHGLLTVGTTMAKAMDCTEYIEEGAHYAYLLKAAGAEVKGIGMDKILEMFEILKSGRAL